ncbi:hypothetical protein [Streptomyces chumphonensis]|uniref:hypothetical protein n=1 Tax=Streptomyces chumphonensis TaxID=1214925 RepID=UPI003D732A5F
MNTARAYHLLAFADRAAPDARTTIADARSALALAGGCHPDDIDPQGYDISDRAYRIVRADWARQVEAGLTCRAMVAGYRRAREVWARRRPDLVADWPHHDEEADE